MKNVMLVVHSHSYYCNMYSLNAVLLIRLASYPRYSCCTERFLHVIIIIHSKVRKKRICMPGTLFGSARS